MKHLFSKKNRGFSLIELMVVISIIAILVAVGTVSFTTAQKRARNASRRGAVKAMQDAFEQYYAVNTDYAASCAAMATSEYLPAGLPTDPKPAPYPDYTCASFDASGGASASTYCTCAQLEDETGNSDDASCAFDNSGDETYYCVRNQQ